jgi:hypothetical protein
VSTDGDQEIVAAVTLPAALDRPFPITYFRTAGASTKQQGFINLHQLAERIRLTTSERKDLLPWLKLARFGDIRSDKSSLRHDRNVLAISGIEADYDGGEVSFDAAVEIALRADLLCLIYTSPSHTEDAPRWRVLCPTSEELPPDRRDKLFGRLNGVFGGIFSGESWTLSQSYFFGSVNRNPSHRAEVLDGTAVDLLHDLDQVWRGKFNTATKRDADGAPRQGPLDEVALLEEIRSGDNYHQASVRLLGRWALTGMPLMQARQQLVDAMEAVLPADRDARWQARRDDVDRCVADIYGSEAEARDNGTSRNTRDRDWPAVPRQRLTALSPATWIARPPSRQWIVPDWIPRGVVTGYYGDGGTGKSLTAMQLMTAMSLGQKWLGLDVLPGRTLGVFCEDDEPELQRRQWSINAMYGASPSQLADLHYLCRFGEDNALITFDGADVGVQTSFAAELHQLCDELRPDLLVLDTIADLFPANENDRAKVRQFVQGSLGGFARKHECGVLVLGHPSVTGLNNGSGQSGSTAWNNTFRSRFYLEREQGDEADASVRILTRKKANYAARDAEVKLRWCDGTFVLPGDTRQRASATDVTWEQIGKIFDEIDRAWDAGRPWSHRPEVRKDGRMLQGWARQELGISEKRMTTLLSEWLMNEFLRYDLFDKTRRLNGLRVVRRLTPEET